MKLEKVLEECNQLEKNSFLKIVDTIISDQPKNYKQIERILQDSQNGIKGLDNQAITSIYLLIENEFSALVHKEFLKTTSQFDITIDIIIRDGNCMMKPDWFSRLYESELKNIKSKVKELQANLISDKSVIEVNRRRDYNIYKSCVDVAFNNDVDNNQDSKITEDELSILIVLAEKLGLSQEEVKLINYVIIPPEKLEIEDVIRSMRNIGIVFHSKKLNQLYIPDEIVKTLRKLRGKEIADKYFRRILKLIREPQINLVCKQYSIDRKLELNEKIKMIIKEGISFSSVLKNDLHRDDATLTDRKLFLNELCDKGLNIEPRLKGVTIEEKIENLKEYFNRVENEESVGISMEGYNHLLLDLKTILPQSKKLIKNEFELQEEDIFNPDLLLDYNIKPRDVLELLSKDEIRNFCQIKEISTRGVEITNILDEYRDSINLLMENYPAVAYRDVNLLKMNGINCRESELGLKFEELTKEIFETLGFQVDEELKNNLNTKKDKIDIILNLGDNNLIVVECKTIKGKGYNKYSAVSRQIKSYISSITSNGYSVIKTLLIAPEFSADFVADCEEEFELNLSLLTAETLHQIFEGFKKSEKHKFLPHKLFMRDIVINSDRILRALNK